MNKIKQIILISLASVFCFVVNGNAFAEDVVVSSMVVSPPRQKLILTPGETYHGAVEVFSSNESKNELKYSASIGSFSENGGDNGKDDYGTVDHISRSNYNQIMDWIKLEKTSGTAAPNETDILRYTINVPEDAPAGGQYATIIIRDDTGDNDGDDGNMVIQNAIQFGMIIYAEVAGETREVGSVIENNVPVISFNSPLVVSSMVENSGNVHTDAKYTLQIYPLFSDEEVYSNEEEPMTSLILPESERYNTQSWNEAPAIGIFKVRQTVEIFGNVSTVEKIVIICPLWLLFIIIVVIVAIIWWIVLKAKNRQKS
ncbi:hypothetical protein IKF57_00895 [Candidatus Saccharibacteria bacterium]|nr:hypothetical protein [Candidatus Saccharibacteria bacterium]